MTTETFQLDIITPCFCAGAESVKQAEVRVPSIRGQLRWWFRTLGGFKSLAPMTVREQETIIFGSVAGKQGRAGKLMVRVQTNLLCSRVKDGQSLGYRSFPDPAYLTFPIQSRERNGQLTQFAGRGVIEGGSFNLIILWQGASALWADVQGLVAVLGHLGALGFRGRRAMGALSFKANSPDLHLALSRFIKPGTITIRTLGATAQDQVIPSLGQWLKKWRAHGRTGNNPAEQRYPGFAKAKADHDHGVARLNGHQQGGPVYRAALGLPIIQFFSSSKKTVNWEWTVDNGKAEGRFASPVLLRPHRDAQGKWHALLIFVDAHKWPVGKQVFLNGQPRTVSRDLYEEMKNDKALKVFP